MLIIAVHLFILVFTNSCDSKLKIKRLNDSRTNKVTQSSHETVSLELTDGSGVNDSGTETNLSWLSP